MPQANLSLFAAVGSLAQRQSGAEGHAAAQSADFHPSAGSHAGFSGSQFVLVEDFLAIESEQ